MTTDSQFGPIVVISAGGTLIELLDDKVALLPRVDRVRARRALDRLAIAPLLHGHRGSPPVDIEAITGLIARFSEMVVDLGSDVASIDLNPVICGPDGAVAVDVLMVRR
jgi:hypothetical protein